MDDGTRMRDEIRFIPPLGALGRVATKVLVRRHVAAFLVERNRGIKQVAESEDWHRYLDGQSVTVALAPAKEGWEPSSLMPSSQS